MTDILPRLNGVLEQLALAELPPRLLNVGCGDFPCAATIHAALPDWMVVGVDRDGAALRRAAGTNGSVHLVRGDARDLPAVLHTRFGVILVRHPDLFRSQAAWMAALPNLLSLLAPGGALVITLYAPEEAEMLRTLVLPPPIALDEAALPRVDLAGRDRFVWAMRR